MSFLTELQTRRLPDGRRELLEPLVWHDGIMRIKVPKGFDTDYSSVPRLARLVMPRWSQTDLAGVVHDYLYRRQYPRPLADVIWRHIAHTTGKPQGRIRQGVHSVQSWLGWAGLRVGGWWAYRKRGA